jgi:Eukaryotic initiation factor 4E
VKSRHIRLDQGLNSVCSLFNNILPPTVLEEKSDLKFFQEGIKPDWDEKETAAGGIWSVPIKRSPEAKDKLEHYWMDVVRCSSTNAVFNTGPSAFFSLASSGM